MTDRSSYGGLFGGQSSGSVGAAPGGAPPGAEDSSPSFGAAASPSKAGLGGLFEQGPQLGGLFDQAPALHEQQGAGHGAGLFGGGLGAGAAQDGRPGALGPSGGLLQLAGGLDGVSSLGRRLPAFRP
jgi:hypothetical protein